MTSLLYPTPNPIKMAAMGLGACQFCLLKRVSCRSLVSFDETEHVLKGAVRCRGAELAFHRLWVVFMSHSVSKVCQLAWVDF